MTRCALAGDANSHTIDGSVKKTWAVKNVRTVLVVPQKNVSCAELVARLEALSVRAHIDRGGTIDLNGIERVLVVMPHDSERVRAIQAVAYRVHPQVQISFASVDSAVDRLKDDMRL